MKKKFVPVELEVIHYNNVIIASDGGFDLPFAPDNDSEKQEVS